MEEQEQSDGVEYPFAEYKDKRLDFLNDRYLMTIELAGTTFQAGKVMLLDQVVPAYNRVVFCDYTFDPAYHSVTPGNGRTRYSIVQWLY